MSKKFLAVFVSAIMTLAATFTLFGCNGSEKSGGGSDSLKIWAAQGDMAFITQQIEEFKAANADFAREINVVQQGEDTAVSVLTNDTKAAADIIHIPHDQLGKAIEAAAIKEIPAAHSSVTQLKADNVESIQKLAMSGTKYYGLPDVLETYLLFYNKSIFTSPTDVATYENMKAKVAAKANSNLYTLGIDLKDNGYFSAAPFLSVGATLYGVDGTDKTNCTFNNAQSKNMVKWMQSEFNVANKMISLKGGDLVNALGSDALSQAASIVAGPWQATEIKAKLGANYAVAKLPTFDMGTGNDDKQMKSFGGVKMYVINNEASGEKAEDALKVVQFLSSKSVQMKRFNAKKHMPTHKDLANDTALLADELAKAFFAQYKFMIPQPAIPEMATKFYAEGHVKITALFENKESAFSTDAKLQAGLDDLVRLTVVAA